MNQSKIAGILNRLLRNTDKAYALADTALNSLFRLASSIVLAKIAGAEVFAQYILITTGIVIVQSLALNYFTTPVIHVAGLEKEKIGALFRWTGKRLKVAQFLLLGGLLFVFAAAHFSPDFEILEYSGFASATLLLLSMQHARAERQTRFDNKRICLGNLLGIAFHVITFAGALKLQFNPLAAYGWSLFVNYLVVYGICKTWVSQRARERELKPQKELASNIQRNGFFMVLGSLTGIFSSRLQPFALAAFTDSLAVAQFGAVMTIAGPIRMGSVFLQTLLRPRLALFHNQQDKRSFNRLTGYSIGFLAIAGICGTIAGLFLEKWLLVSVFEFHSEALVGGLLPIAMIYTTIDSITSVRMLEMQVGLKNGVAITTKLRFFAALFTSVLIIPLCILMGSKGALLSLLMGETVYLLLSFRYTSRKSLTFSEDPSLLVTPAS